MIKHARQLIQAFQPIDIVDFGRGRMSKIAKNKNQKKTFRCLFFTNVRPFAHVSENQMCIAACNNSLRAMVVWILGLTYTCVRQAARFQVQNSPRQERSVYRSKERRGRPR